MNGKGIKNKKNYFDAGISLLAEKVSEYVRKKTVKLKEEMKTLKEKFKKIKKSKFHKNFFFCNISKNSSSSVVIIHKCEKNIIPTLDFGFSFGYKIFQVF